MSETPTTDFELDVKTFPSRCTVCESLQHAPTACVDCHELLAHVMGADYFELFGLPRTYEISEAELNAKYLAISRNIHPDRFAAAGGDMQTFALRSSSLINKAHGVLKDSYHRAEYLLEISGGKSAAQDKSVPGTLLADMMTLREEIEEAKAANNSAALAAIAAQTRERRDATQADIARLAGTLADSADEATRDELRRQLNAMKYLNNLLAELSTAEATIRT